ncbi:hypothetical protein [Streptococcus pantholopis]|nr:hypothetical protein [Streptococcus pantholopis]
MMDRELAALDKRIRERHYTKPSQKEKTKLSSDADKEQVPLTPAQKQLACQERLAELKKEENTLERQEMAVQRQKTALESQDEWFEVYSRQLTLLTAELEGVYAVFSYGLTEDWSSQKRRLREAFEEDRERVLKERTQTEEALEAVKKERRHIFRTGEV